MRFLLPAVAFMLALSALAGWSRASAASPSTAPPGAAATGAAPAKPASTAAASSADDAAARHAKRTACIHQARAKKLVGAQKTAFIQSCIGTP